MSITKDFMLEEKKQKKRVLKNLIEKKEYSHEVYRSMISV